jgi:quercetin dioxygenase-like cupin family protein
MRAVGGDGHGVAADDVDSYGRPMCDGCMASADEQPAPGVPTILPPDVQDAVWFLGALVRIRSGGDATGGKLAILEHQSERGFSTPVHRHDIADETFLVLEGELRVEVDGKARAVGAGATAFLPRGRPHALLVTSPQARYLTLHTPAGFDSFTRAVGTPVTTDTPPDEPPPDPATLAALARAHGIEFLGPPLTLDP